MITFENGYINIIVSDRKYSIIEDDAKIILDELRELYEDKNFNIDWFKEAWSKYPKKLDKKAAIRHFKKYIRNRESFDNLLKAIDNYIKYCNKNKSYQYIMNGGRFFLNYEDWIDYNEQDVIKTVRDELKLKNQECSTINLEKNVTELTDSKINKPGKISFSKSIFNKGGK